MIGKEKAVCQFSDIAHCPLYIESHNGTGLGCVDDMSQPCLVERGKMDFQGACWKLVREGRDYPGLLQALDTAGAA